MANAYSETLKFNNLVFISGQIGNSSDGTIPKEFGGQLRNAFANLIKCLNEESLEITDVVKLNVYLTNNDHYTILDLISKEYFDTHKPVRTTLIVAGLPRKHNEPELLVEIDAIAGKR